MLLNVSSAGLDQGCSLVMPAQILFCFNPDYTLLADSLALQILVQNI